MRKPFLTIALALVTASLAASESNSESVRPVFQTQESTWSAGFLDTTGKIVVHPHTDLPDSVPVAAPTRDIPPSGVGPASLETVFDDVANLEGETASLHAASLNDLSVNVPDLPAVLDRMGTAVLILAGCLVAALFYRRTRGARSRAAGPAQRMRVVSRLLLSRKGEMCLVEVDNRLVVVGLDTQGIRSLVPLEAKPVPTFAELHEETLLRTERKRDRVRASQAPRPAATRH